MEILLSIGIALYMLGNRLESCKTRPEDLLREKTVEESIDSALDPQEYVLGLQIGGCIELKEKILALREMAQRRLGSGGCSPRFLLQ